MANNRIYFSVGPTGDNNPKTSVFSPRPLWAQQTTLIPHLNRPGATGFPSAPDSAAKVGLTIRTTTVNHMQLSSARRRNRNACPRFVTTSVVSEQLPIYSQHLQSMDAPEKCLEFWNAVIATQPDHEPEKESVVVVLLNTRLTPLGWNRVSLGTVNESHAHPREVLRPVIASAAFGFVLMHNHPSGDPSPSRSDEQITRRMVEAATLMQIRFVDHVITGQSAPGRSAYYSFREAGLIP